MEKYGTFILVRNVLTGEVRQIPKTDEEELEKTGALKDWIEITPDYIKETDEVKIWQ